MDQGSGAAGLSANPDAPPAPEQPTAAVSALYQEHALAMIRLAHIILGNRATAEDVVQDAFCGLYRRWDHVASKDKVVSYLRSSVLNGCRSVLRQNRPGELTEAYQPIAISAEATALTAEERKQVVRAVRRLPERQRDVLVLRYYLDLGDDKIAADLGVSINTVRSTRRRGLLSLERLLKEAS
ncbi:MAG TPA: SigE family RNA polymerase sigma factor [Streptosporangiaceae bacterium]|nr:SigE family RNA polymerase sigma factor [Streptosporangiaceae bacterium]